MASTFAGIGTRFYGKEEIDKKNAYTATKWIVFLYIPIFPIGSFRTNSAGADGNITTRVTLQWLHVCNVYAFFVAIALLAYLGFGRQETEFADTDSLPSEVSDVDLGSEDLELLIPVEPAYERPTAAENGTPFPKASGYIEGYEQAFTTGRTVLTVDNGKNNYDIYVKLYNLDVTLPGLASVFFVKANDQFTVEQITPGSYELRYRNLDTGDLFRTDALSLEETVDPSGNTTFTHLTVGLYGAIDGEMEIYPITEEDF